MLDISRIRNNPKQVEEKLNRRDKSISLEEIRELDKQRRELISKVEKLRHERNEGSQKVGELKREGKEDQAQQLIDRLSHLGGRIDELEEKQEEVESKLHSQMARLPNIPDDSVPVSFDEEDKVILEEFGERREWDFEPKSHLELSQKLDLLDFERAAKIAGSRFPMYTGQGAALEMSVIQFMFFYQMNQNDYNPVFPPFLANEDSYYTSGQLPKFGEELYYCQQDDLYLNPTSESILVNIFRDEILAPDQLPHKLCAYSTCFRREAGSYGEEERGLIRTHQFNKVELFQFVKPQESYQRLNGLIQDAEEILEKLGLHYRKVLLPTCDLAQQSTKTIDLEVWLPTQQKYYEVSSCSNCEAFQARRGNIRYRPAPEAKPRYVHTLNGSGLATSRLVAALLENNQLPDGSIEIPEVLADTLGQEIIS